MTKESWIDINGYEGLYQVSNLGRVKSLRRTKPNGQIVIERILKEWDHSHGYKQISLSKNGVMHKEYVHRLVAIHFLSNPMNYKYINHKDHRERRSYAKTKNAISLGVRPVITLKPELEVKKRMLKMGITELFVCIR